MGKVKIAFNKRELRLKVKREIDDNSECTSIISQSENDLTSGRENGYANGGLSLLQRCKIAVWMDQFGSEEVVQSKFKDAFGSSSPPLNMIRDIHHKFITNGNVLDEETQIVSYKDPEFDFDHENMMDVTLQDIGDIGGLTQDFHDKKNYYVDSLDFFKVSSVDSVVCTTKKDKLFAKMESFEECTESELSENSKDIYQCFHCGLKCASKATYDSHVLVHTSDFFQCIKCSFTSNSTTALRSHQKCCSALLMSNTIEINHVAEASDSGCHTCTVCGRAYASLQSLKMHQAYHSDLRPFPCSQCTYRFNSEKTLIKHLVTHDKIKHLECPHCSYNSNVSGNMIVHIRTHSGEKPFRCNHCNYSSYSSSILKRHLLIHNKFHKYKCSECNYTTHRDCLLTNHQQIHSSEENYECHLCKGRFKTPHNLKYHLKKFHTEQKLVECPFCDYRQSDINSLKMHIRTHTGERPYECPKCDFKASRTQEIKRHREREH